MKGGSYVEIVQNSMTMTRGDTETITIKKTDKDNASVPFSEGDTVYFTVKKSIHDIDKTLQKVVTSFTDGNALIEISHNDTKDIVCGTYLYDVQLTDKNGVVTTLVKPSRFYIQGEITYE